MRRRRRRRPLLSFDSGLTLVQADNSITSNAYNYAQTLTAATQSVPPLITVFPANNALAAQLKQIAQIIQVRAALGVTRQIFFCGIGNFDTHADQLTLQESTAGFDQPGTGGVLRGDGGDGSAEQRDDVHNVGLQPTFQPNSNAGATMRGARTIS